MTIKTAFLSFITLPCLLAASAVVQAQSYYFVIPAKGLKQTAPEPTMFESSFSAFSGGSGSFIWVPTASGCQPVNSDTQGSTFAVANQTCSYVLSDNGSPSPQSIALSEVESLVATFDVHLSDYATNYSGLVGLTNFADWVWQRGSYGQLYGTLSFVSGGASTVVNANTRADTWASVRFQYTVGEGLSLFHNGSEIFTDPDFQPSDGATSVFRSQVAANQMNVRNISVQWTEKAAP